MFQKLVDQLKAHGSLPEDLTYEEARAVLEKDNARAKRQLAARDDAGAEILYFLASEKDAEIRTLVAENPATPRQADVVLADDEDDEVRVGLASKIGRLLPDLTAEENTKIRELTIATLEKLASDQLPRVRKLVAEEIKRADTVPLHIVRELARDAELSVCGPILQYSPLLNDEDLLEIIASSRVTGALERIAQRGEVSEAVADAVVATLDIPAVAALLANKNAQIREDTLDQIVHQAESVDAWHEPLVMRPDLSVRAVRRIAGFVAYSLIEGLAGRHDLDAQTEAYLKRRMRVRIETDIPEPEELGESDAGQLLEEAKKRGALNADFVLEAVDAGEREVAVKALADLAGYQPELVNRILRASSAKAVTALAWKAGLSMRGALKLQASLAKIPPKEQLPAKDGVDFPLDEDEMTWHLAYFEGGKA